MSRNQEFIDLNDRDLLDTFGEHDHESFSAVDYAVQLHYQNLQQQNSSNSSSNNNNIHINKINPYLTSEFMFQNLPAPSHHTNSNSHGIYPGSQLGISNLESLEWRLYQAQDAGDEEFNINTTVNINIPSFAYQQHMNANSSEKSDKTENGFHPGNSTTVNRPSDNQKLVKAQASTAAKERRKERNKVLARKTRQKKKAEMEGLRDRVLSLMVENEKLKMILQTENERRLPLVSAASLLHTDFTLPENITAMVKQMINNNEKTNLNEITIKQRSFCLVNPNAADSPIVYVSPGFINLTGYTREECLGRNCRFLQGPETDKDEVSELCEALKAGKDFSTILLNYHKDNTAFWNKIEIAHLRGHDHRVKLLVGVQTKCGPHCLRTRLARQRATQSLLQLQHQPHQQHHQHHHLNQQHNNHPPQIIQTNNINAIISNRKAGSEINDMNLFGRSESSQVVNALASNSATSTEETSGSTMSTNSDRDNSEASELG